MAQTPDNAPLFDWLDNAIGKLPSSGQIILNFDGNTVKWYVDPATGRLLRSIARGSGPMPGDVVTDYSDWKTFGGLNLPTTSVVTRNGEKAAEVKVTEIVVNPTVDANAFTKPEK